MPPPPRNITPPPLYRFPLQLGWIVRGILVLIVLSAILSCFSQVPADSVGVLTRFGAYHGTAGPGLVWKLPLGIDQLKIVEVERQLKLEFGFSTPSATDPYQGSPEGALEESMVTGDLNMALVRWVVQYRIQDAKKFLFDVEEPKATLRDASEAAMREVVGDRTVDEVLTIGRQEVESEALKRLVELAERYGLGVTIMQVQLKDVHPPAPVQLSFNEVNQAQQEKEQQINMAKGEYNKAVPRAKGEAQQRISEADGYAVRRVNEARGDADRFKAQFTEFAKAPEVTRQRLYLETMAEILPQLDRKIILDDKSGQLLPLMPLDFNARPAAAAAPQILSR